MTKGNKNKWWLNGGRGSGKTIRALCEVYSNRIADLEQQIEKMKCCGNCNWNWSCTSKKGKACEEWELKND